MNTNGDIRAITSTCADLMARLVYTAHHKVEWKRVPKDIPRDHYMKEAAAMLTEWTETYGVPADTYEIAAVAMHWADTKWTDGNDFPITEPR